MTEQQQNDALAKWLTERTSESTANYYVYSFGTLSQMDLENYRDCLARKCYGARHIRLFTNSLDTMALIEAALQGEEIHAYALEVEKLLPLFKHCLNYAFGLITATAAQRAEAACKALGLWVESGKDNTGDEKTDR